MKYKLITLFTLFATSLFAQTSGETIYTFLNAPTAPKQIALGGAVLTSKNDVSQLLWNPSAVNLEVDGDISANFVSYIADINVGSLVYAKSINPKYGIAFLGIQYFDYGDFDRTEATGPEVLGLFTSKDLAFSLGYGYQYQDFSFGLSLKYISSKIDVFTSNAILYDLGVTYTHPEKPLVASLVIRNSGKQLTEYIDTEEKVSSNIGLSAEYRLEHIPIKIYGALDDIGNWDISAPNPSRSKKVFDGADEPEEISEVQNAFRHLSLGAELWPEKLFNLRIGYNARRAQEFQLEPARTNAGLSYGFGINTKFIKFDYAFSKFQEGAKYSTFGLTLHL